jgi:hypothetical protein
MMHRTSNLQRFAILCSLLILAADPACVSSQPAPAAVSAFNSYISTVEARLTQQHRSQNGFIVPVTSAAQSETRLRSEELIVERAQAIRLVRTCPERCCHHWRGTAFAPGAGAADFERLMKDFNALPQTLFSPGASGKSPHRTGRSSSGGDAGTPAARHHGGDGHLLRHHLTDCWIRGTDTASPGARESQEIDSPGSARRAGTRLPKKEHGFLWRLNTYWSYEERDGGLYMQIESISLTRSIPRGLGWVVGPFVEGVPRESLEFTLRSTCNTLRKLPQTGN